MSIRSLGSAGNCGDAIRRGALLFTLWLAYEWEWATRQRR